MVEVGIADRLSGAGVRDTGAWEIGDPITDRTAAVAYLPTPGSRLALAEVVEVAHARGAPVIVDVAAQLPPASNLKWFISTGADLVCFFGGKAIQGPQTSGILCGRRDLISAAAPQHLDQDVLFELWNPPPSLIDKRRLPGAPKHGLGRPCKVGKEEIVGLVTALQYFVKESDEARRATREAKVKALVEPLTNLPHIQVTTVALPGRPVPLARLELDEERLSLRPTELTKQLATSSPAIHVNTSQIYEPVLLFDPICLLNGDLKAIADRLRQLIR